MIDLNRTWKDVDICVLHVKPSFCVSDIQKKCIYASVAKFLNVFS